MKTAFPKDISDCMRDCILAIFWPKDHIISFFQNNGCTLRDLGNACNYKELQLSRAKIVDIVFEGLAARDDGGLGQFRSMLQSLKDWSHFDSYYFDKLHKLDRKEAMRLITHLKQLQEIRDAKVKEKREQRVKKEDQVVQTIKTLEQLKKQFTNLYQARDEQGKAITLQRRGYLFEAFLRDLCLHENVPVSEPFKVTGEQIDGTIKFEGENYIVEAKWHDYLTASDALYQFAHKVEGKMYGRGIFFSVNGFSQESVTALHTGKALKTVLFDGGDLSLVVEGLWTFTRMLDYKIKAAQTMGRIYVDVNTMQDKQGRANST